MSKSGVRLAGGRWRGRRLTAAGGVRPTEGRVREALASIWLPRLEGARVLDLFAGSGAVGLELMSRGASSAMLVDKNPKVISALKSNVASIAADNVQVRRLEMPRSAGQLQGGPGFDLIFADPPYAFECYGPLLAAVAPLARQGAELVVEHAGDRDWISEIQAAGEEAASAEQEAAAGCWSFNDQRRYGDCALSFFAVSG